MVSLMSTSNARVQKHRENLRNKGLKLVQIWVPDTNKKGFKEECRRQALLIKQDEQDLDIDAFIENSADLGGWE
jgi:hypothetical protein